MGAEHWGQPRRSGRWDGPQGHRPTSWVMALYDCVERLLLHVALLGLVALVLFQLLQTQAVVRRLLSPLERLEGQDPGAWYPAPGAWSTGDAPVQAPAPDPAPAGRAAAPVAASYATAPVHRGRVTVILLSRPSAAEAHLLVGGETAGDFSHGRVTATVLPGQELAVDGRHVDDTLTFRVVGVEGVAAPALGTQITTDRDVRSFGFARAP